MGVCSNVTHPHFLLHLTNCMNLLNDLYNVLLPRRCVVCQDILEPNEQYLCAACSVRLPRYPIENIEDNEVVRKVWNYAPVLYGATLLYYRHYSDFHNREQSGNYHRELNHRADPETEVTSFFYIYCNPWTDL